MFLSQSQIDTSGAIVDNPAAGAPMDQITVTATKLPGLTAWPWAAAALVIGYLYARRGRA